MRKDGHDLREGNIHQEIVRPFADEGVRLMKRKEVFFQRKHRRENRGLSRDEHVGRGFLTVRKEATFSGKGKGGINEGSLRMRTSSGHNNHL